MRVRAGRLKGRQLAYPRSGLRPTKDITRQAIFNVLGRRLRGSRCLDLYAGGGSLGVEALSRGAEEAVFVEQHPAIARFLRENLRGLEGVKVVRGDVLKALPKLTGNGFDVILADPPYRQGLVQQTVDRVSELGMLNPGGMMVVEHHRLELPDAPDGWETVKQGKYGDSLITVFRRSE